ncbi:MAG: sugar phosphate isomerase/epimerase [Firmicutes bacterium]|nr:sugar phosphate isomerase/epimerase [Bacillota bacterium]
MLPLGIITDEVHDDLKTSCRFVESVGIDLVELRTIDGKNILELPDDAVFEAKSILDEYDLKVAGISSPIFKSPLEGNDQVGCEGDFMLEGFTTFKDQLSLLERAAALCQIFDTPLLRVFTFLRVGWSASIVEKIAACLLEAAEIAEKHKLILAVENEPICNARYGRELGELFDYLKKSAPSNLLDHLTILWDPGNAFYAGELDCVKEGYEAIRGRVGHVHVKDVFFGGDGKPLCVPVGSGGVDYIYQISALLDDGYSGPLILEPHYIPEGKTRLEGAREAVDALRRLLGAV